MERNKLGQFKRESNLGRQSLVVLIIIIITSSACVYYFYKHPYKIVLPPVEIDKSSEVLAGKIEALKNAVVNDIRSCESNGYTEADGLIIFDTNKVASIGRLQFQVKTIVYYEKTLNHRVITGKEAIQIALDDTLSGELAKQILFSTKNGHTNWLNCSNKLNIEARVNAINNLTN